jgi:hypothetical protein
MKFGYKSLHFSKLLHFQSTIFWFYSTPPRIIHFLGEVIAECSVKTVQFHSIKLVYPSCSLNAFDRCDINNGPTPMGFRINCPSLTSSIRFLCAVCPQNPFSVCTVTRDVSCLPLFGTGRNKKRRILYVRLNLWRSSIHRGYIPEMCDTLKWRSMCENCCL